MPGSCEMKDLNVRTAPSPYQGLYGLIQDPGSEAASYHAKDRRVGVEPVTFERQGSQASAIEGNEPGSERITGIHPFGKPLGGRERSVCVNRPPAHYSIGQAGVGVLLLDEEGNRCPVRRPAGRDGYIASCCDHHLDRSLAELFGNRRGSSAYDHRNSQVGRTKGTFESSKLDLHEVVTRIRNSLGLEPCATEEDDLFLSNTGPLQRFGYRQPRKDMATRSRRCDAIAHRWACIPPARPWPAMLTRTPALAMAITMAVPP